MYYWNDQIDTLEKFIVLIYICHYFESTVECICYHCASKRIVDELVAEADPQDRDFRLNTAIQQCDLARDPITVVRIVDTSRTSRKHDSVKIINSSVGRSIWKYMILSFRKQLD